MPEYGTIHTQLDVRKKDGGIYKLEVVNPFALLHTVLLHCAVFAQAFSAAVVARTPSFTSPWHIALYGDEVVPGNPLKGQNFRKTYAFYWSFTELGHGLLARETAWLCVAAIRTSKLTLFGGGISYVVGEILEK